ncbi:uridine diphosphate glucose pyrophosphatase NUDT14-like [Glossina fuscipes]|uniref:Uridine diphosphate glucose pyrophosphatase NUDT14 n=1 Tax=Glossina fuscipes TaxID=7396 RepID=A0A8U0WLS3_9MUSC|nr:uridine diphosphate glucose pyrophosphatase NUDT14-like [Glossina fuscipes]
MEKIDKMWIAPLPTDSAYVKTFRLHYIQNGKEKSWDALKVHDSVSIVIFNTTRQKLVFVKQFRPLVYHSIVTSNGGDVANVDLGKFPIELGVTLEICAGTVDKDKSWREIAREEILEECGYDVPVDQLEEIFSYRCGVGTQGSKQIMYYCEVTDNQKKSPGGGVGDEIIDVVEYSVDEARAMVYQKGNINGPPSFLLGVLWFLMNKRSNK